MGIKGKNDKMVVLACENCKERNYTTVKNKKTLKIFTDNFVSSKNHSIFAPHLKGMGH